MAKSLGFCFEQDGIKYCCLEGTKESPILVKYDKASFPNINEKSDLTNWAESYIRQIINEHNPDTIGAKLSLKAEKNNIASWYYPMAMLHYVLYSQNKTATEFVSQNFTATKFGMSKSVNIYEEIDNIFGTQSPKLDKNYKYALLSAWMVL